MPLRRCPHARLGNLVTLIYLTIAWTLGILLARSLSLSAWWLFGLTVTLCGASLVPWVRRRRLMVAAAAVALLGGWRVWASQARFDADDLAAYNGAGPVSVWGYVSSDPSIRDTYTQIEVSASWLDAGSGPRRVRGRAVLNVPLYPEHAYGERLLLYGELGTPPILDTFSYREYLAARGVHSTMRRAESTTLAGLSGSPILRGVYRLRAGTRRAIEAILPYPEAGLLAGILLGLDHTLPDELADAFRLAGLSHIIVISGFNIGIIAQAVMLASRRWAHRWTSLVVSMVAIGLFTLFVGPSAPVVRAAWMGGLAITAELLGRRSHALTSLAASSLAMTLANPLTLWSVSFQLSFVATLALIVVAPLLGGIPRTRAVPTTGSADAHPRLKDGFRDLFFITLAAQAASMPLIWAHFGQISLLALPANLLVLPLQPAIMALGAGATLLGALSLPLGRAAAWLVWPLLRACIVVVRACARVPWGAVIPPHPHPLLIWGLYGGLLALALLAARRRPQDPPGSRPGRVAPRWLPVALLATLVVAMLGREIARRLPDGRLHVYMLDVGQGDAMLLRLPRGALVLVDGGPDPGLLATRLGQLLPFWHRRVDLVVATHADADHLTGLLPLPGRYQVGRVLQAPMPAGALAEAWQQELDGASIVPLEPVHGTRLAMGDAVAMQVVDPGSIAAAGVGEANAATLALQLTMGRFAAMLTADADAQDEHDWLANSLPLRATVLKVAHHGSGGSTTAELIAAVDPQVALISVGAGNRFGHPSAEVLERLEAAGVQVYRTDRDGTVELITDGERLWVRSHVSGR
jgi:competence protein ComEC